MPDWSNQMDMIVRSLLSGCCREPGRRVIIDHAGLLHNCDLSLFLLFIYFFLSQTANLFQPNLGVRLMNPVMCYDY
jgi:hypothetical protein